MIKQCALLFALAVAAAPVVAEPVRFNFEFVEPQGTARATGYIVFETTELANPGSNQIVLPSPAVLDLSVTVTGADAGNGTFTLVDFTSVAFDTNEGTLDFTQSLIGQATAGLPWGTSTNEGAAGDFNLFSGPVQGPGIGRYAPQEPRGVGNPAPNGEYWFTLGANGGAANQMVLAAMAPAGTLVPDVPVPVDSRLALGALLLLVAGAGVIAVRRRTSH